MKTIKNEMLIRSILILSRNVRSPARISVTPSLIEHFNMIDHQKPKSRESSNDLIKAFISFPIVKFCVFQNRSKIGSFRSFKYMLNIVINTLLPQKAPRAHKFKSADI